MEVLHRLDSRHDELIQKLDELNAQIEQALAEFAKSRTAPPRGSQTQDGPTHEQAALRRAA
jgi:hypothetical protein